MSKPSKYLKQFVYIDRFDSVTIMGSPTEDDKNRYNHWTTYVDETYSGEETLLAPGTRILKNIRVYEVKYTSNGCLKRGKELYRLSQLKPSEALILNIYCNCGAPNRVLSVADGTRATYYFSENGFNGNRSLHIVGYEKTWLSRVYDLLGIS